MISQAKTLNSLHGVKISRNHPLISQLLYANDIILFLWENLSEVTTLKQILDNYYL